MIYKWVFRGDGDQVLGIMLRGRRLQIGGNARHVELMGHILRDYFGAVRYMEKQTALNKMVLMPLREFTHEEAAQACQRLRDDRFTVEAVESLGRILR